jgi:Rdx family protein
MFVGLELKTGTKGVFRVTLDHEIVYDKGTTNRKPHQSELAGLIEGRLGPRLAWRQTRAG